MRKASIGFVLLLVIFVGIREIKRDDRKKPTLFQNDFREVITLRRVRTTKKVPLHEAAIEDT